MLNQAIVVGRFTENLSLNENGELKSKIAVTRCYKNEDGIYETDFIPFRAKGNIAAQAYAYCKKGDVVGIKGTLIVENDCMIIEVEKITFLSSTSNSNKIEEEK